MSDLGITREKALELLSKNIKNENLLKHCYATEAVMRKLARRLGEDEEKWAMAGLLHDLDVELVNGDMHAHGLKTAEILREQGVQQDIIEAIKMHNETAVGQKRNNVFHHALAASETITGLIVATALVYPDKKLASVKVESIIKRMKEKRFAASVNRETIKECEKFGMGLKDFCELALSAMQEISNVMGL